MRRLLIPGIIVCLLAGYLAGAMSVLRYRHRQSWTVEQVEREAVATVELIGRKGSDIVGEVQGDVRLLSNGKQIIPDDTGTVRIPFSALNVEQVEVHIPVGMHFVASRKGKFYYSVTSADASRLAPENRVYFATEQEAVSAGFAPAAK